MAQKNKISATVRIEEIEIEVPRCPGCNHQHSFKMDKPMTRRNCSYQKGGFIATVKAIPGGQLSVGVTFIDMQQQTFDITNDVKISF